MIINGTHTWCSSRASSKHLFFGCERTKNECFTCPTMGTGTRLGVFSSRRWKPTNLPYARARAHTHIGSQTHRPTHAGRCASVRAFMCVRSLSLERSFSLSIYLYLSLSLSLSRALFLSLSLSLSLTLSLSLAHSLSLSLSLSLGVGSTETDAQLLSLGSRLRGSGFSFSF